jgi:hypothetical protein
LVRTETGWPITWQAAGRSINQSIDWLAGQSVDWLADRPPILAARTTGQLISEPSKRQTDWQTSCPTIWVAKISQRSTDQSTNYLANQSIDQPAACQMIGQPVSVLTNWTSQPNVDRVANRPTER